MDVPPIDWGRLDQLLRGADFKVGPAQHIEAQRLIEALPKASLDVSDAQLAQYLGPIYCVSQTQQELFPKLLEVALGIPRSGPPAAASFPPGRRFGFLRTGRCGLVACVLVAVLLLAILRAAVYSQQGATYYNIQAGDAASTLNEFSRQSEVQVLFDFNVLRGIKTRAIEGSYTASDGLRRMLRGTGLRFDYLPPPSKRVMTEARSTVRDTVAVTRSSMQSTPSVGEHTGTFASAPALISLLLLLCLGMYWFLRHRARLGHPSDRMPEPIRDLSTGERRSLELALRWTDAGHELRRRQWVETGNLNVEATLKTFCGQRPPRLIFGRRVEPEYVALIDENWRSDHMARLADVMLLALGAVDISMERFFFWDSPLVCEGPAPDRRPRPSFLPTIRLEELLGRHRDARLIVVSDASFLFDTATGHPRKWVPLLLEAGSAIVLTPIHRDGWGPRERALFELGFAVLPLTAAGLTEMGELYSSKGSSGATGGVALRKRPPRWIYDPGSLLLPAPPKYLRPAQLCKELREELGDDGFLLLQAAAVYPEIHWGMTVRIGLALLPGGRLAEALPRLVGLPWFRQAYMPDWLRSELVSTLPESQRSRVRRILTRQFREPGVTSLQIERS